MNDTDQPANTSPITGLINDVKDGKLSPQMDLEKFVYIDRDCDVFKTGDAAGSPGGGESVRSHRMQARHRREDAMTNWGHVMRCCVLVAGSVTLVAGCSSSGEDSQPSSGTTGSPSSSLAADVPKGYDPCSDIPAGILDSEGLGYKSIDNFQAGGGKILWRGCTWVSPDSYGARIQTTNITVDSVRGKHFPDAREFTIDGRRAITSRQIDAHPQEACTLDVEMKGGSLEFNLTNPPYLPKTGKTDTCQLAEGLATKVVPTLPASV